MEKEQMQESERHCLRCAATTTEIGRLEAELSAEKVRSAEITSHWGKALEREGQALSLCKEIKSIADSWKSMYESLEQ